MSKIIIVHSLSEDKLRKAVELGGMPLPSIAAMKPDNEFTRFGNITFILKPESVNPKDKKNLFFDRDIFSQRIPEIYYDIDKKALSSLHKQLDTMVDNNKKLGSLFNVYDLSSLKTKPSHYIEDRLRSSYLVKLMFMNNMNPAYSIPYKVDKLESDLSADLVFQEYMKNRIQTIQHDDDFKKAIHDVLERRHSLYKETIGVTIADDLRADYTNSIFNKQGDINSYSKEIEKVINDVKRYNGDATILDGDKIRDELNKFVEHNMAEYNNFFVTLTQDIFVKPHLKNGTKKVEYNLDTISKYMLRQQVTGAEDVNDTSIGKISSSYSTQFTSYDDMIDYVDKLDTMEDRHNQIEILNRRISNLTEQLKPYSPYLRSFDAQECLSLALTRVSTLEQFSTKLAKQGFDVTAIPQEVINEGFDICHGIKNLSSHYFEGKPQKVIYFDDFQAVALPKNTSPDIIKALDGKMNIHFYETQEEKKAIFSKYSFDSAPKKLNKLKNF
jgi:hypothetical protein